MGADMSKILRLLTRLCEAGGIVTLLPFIVNANGLDRLFDVVATLEMIDESALERWTALERLVKFLDLILAANMDAHKFGSALQAKLRAVVDESSFSRSLLERP